MVSPTTIISVAIGTAVTAPVVIPAVVGALGFGSGGIAGGSTAAWMMSLGKGLTPAAVSTCQSIGATGAISSSTSAIVGAVGGAVAKWGPAAGNIAVVSLRWTYNTVKSFW